MAAKAVLEGLRPIAGSGVLLTARRGAARMCAARLRDGGLALYSPIPEWSDAMEESLAVYGAVEALIAPSHFHHLGIGPWSERFSDARLFASEAAQPRVERQVGLTFEPMAALEPQLPNGATLLHPAGVKAGEVWLRVETPNGIAWVVCDAFAAAAKPDDPPQTAPKARGAFDAMCVSDMDAYKAWALAQVEADRPRVLVPAHGGLVVADDLPLKLATLLEAI